MTVQIGCEITTSSTAFVGYGDVFPDGMKCGTSRDQRKFCFRGDCVDPRDCSEAGRRNGFCRAPKDILFVDERTASLDQQPA